MNIIEKTCPDCYAILPLNLRRCNYCGHKFDCYQNGIAIAMRKRYPRKQRIINRNEKRRQNPRNSWEREWEE